MLWEISAQFFFKCCWDNKVMCYHNLSSKPMGRRLLSRGKKKLWSYSLGQCIARLSAFLLPLLNLTTDDYTLPQNLQENADHFKWKAPASNTPIHFLSRERQPRLVLFFLADGKSGRYHTAVKGLSVLSSITLGCLQMLATPAPGIPTPLLPSQGTRNTWIIGAI